jgi:hypothetical protein
MGNKKKNLELNKNLLSNSQLFANVGKKSLGFGSSGKILDGVG